jgi:two-component system, cell cycle response regulator DivK
VTPAPPAGDGGEGGAGAPLVLVVDDSERNLKLARDVLRADGLRTLEALNGADAIRLAEEHVPDVVLLDLQLPDLHGTEVARRLVRGTRTAGIPIVALSAQPVEATREWLAATGFAGFLEKPVRVEAFPGQVRAYCRRARR